MSINFDEKDSFFTFQMLAKLASDDATSLFIVTARKFHHNLEKDILLITLSMKYGWVYFTKGRSERSYYEGLSYLGKFVHR